MWCRDTYGEKMNVLAVVSDNGDVLWVPPSKVHATCEMENVDWNDNSTEISCALK